MIIIFPIDLWVIDLFLILTYKWFCPIFSLPYPYHNGKITISKNTACQLFSWIKNDMQIMRTNFDYYCLLIYYWKTVLFWWEKYQKYQKQNMKDKIKKNANQLFNSKIIVYDKKWAAWVSLFQENNVPKNGHLIK